MLFWSGLKKESPLSFRWIGKSECGSTVTLVKLDISKFVAPPYATPEWLTANVDLLRTGVTIDVETTGLSHSEDTIIEIGLRQFQFNKATGEILAIGKAYSAFQDPGRPLSKEITIITGITDEMLAGKSIDWTQVDHLLSEASVIVAHNAKFDRPFIEKKSKLSAQKVWACSIKQIDWFNKGYTSPKLELLNIYHGFFTDSHRAINDAEALLYLLSLPQPGSQHSYLAELLANARRTMTQVIASSAPFESKDFLKSRGYSWDNLNRFWSKLIYKDELPAETAWLEEIVYCGTFGGITRDIALTDNFKN